MAVAAAIVLTRIRGTAGGRVAALIATGLLPGLAGDFSFAGNLTAYTVSLLGSDPRISVKPVLVRINAVVHVWTSSQRCPP